MKFKNKKKLVLEIILIFLFIPLIMLFKNLSNYFLLVIIFTSLMIISNYRITNKEIYLKKNDLVFFLKSSFLLSIVIFTYAYIFEQDNFLTLFKNSTQIWVMVMIAYPILSVVPQEIIYRFFFFKRYASLFPNQKVMIVFNAILFSFGHIIFLNIQALLLSFFSSILFSRVFFSRGLLVCILIHSLAGQIVFTSGLGKFFYHGTIKIFN